MFSKSLYNDLLFSRENSDMKNVGDKKQNYTFLASNTKELQHNPFLHSLIKHETSLTISFKVDHHASVFLRRRSDRVGLAQSEACPPLTR